MYISSGKLVIQSWSVVVVFLSNLLQNFHNGLIKEKCPPVQADVKYTWGVSLEDEFTPAQCMERIAANCEGFKLGAVIDLTYTDRYYNRRVRNYVF